MINVNSKRSNNADARFYQLTENLKGRISYSVMMLDDTPRLSEELEVRGVSVELINYGEVCGDDGKLVPALLGLLIMRCATELLLVVDVAKGDAILPGVKSALDELSATYAYKTIFSSDYGCYIVEGGAKK